jgi:hypothetical protein
MGSFGVSIEQPHRRALLVGAWDYTRTPKGDFESLQIEGHLPGPVEDVKALEHILISKFQFKQEDIKVLTTKQETTRQSIIETFNSFLIAQTNPGDIIYFHYSGHGSQIIDEDALDAKGRVVNKNLVVDEPDGLDETLVPTDYGANGANEIRDDEINLLVSCLINKHPASVVLSFDSCNSGSVVRGRATAATRGKSWEQRVDWNVPKPHAKLNPAVRGEDVEELLDKRALMAKDYVSFTAARGKEKAWQVYDPQKRIYMGRFTNAFATALSESDPHMTYEELFSRVKALMASPYSVQHPQIEGRATQLVFNGTAAPVQKYISVYANTHGDLILDAGSLQWITAGSIFALYSAKADDLTTAKPIAEAVVEEVRPGDSTLRLNTTTTDNIRTDGPLFLKGIEVEHQYASTRLKVNVEDVVCLPRSTEVLHRIGTLPLVEISQQRGAPWDVRLVCEPARKKALEGTALGRFILERSDGSIISEVADVEGAPDAIVLALKREAKWRYAKSLENRSPQSSVKVRMRVIPVETKGDSTQGFEYVRDKPWTEELPLHKGSCVVVEVMNLGDRDAYITLLDLLSDGEIHQLWPDPPIADNFISINDKGKWIRLWDGAKSQPFLIELGEPYGIEIFKLISTRKQMSFNPLVTRRTLTPLEKLIRGAIGGTGIEGLNSVDDWYTDAITFEVQP